MFPLLPIPIQEARDSSPSSTCTLGVDLAAQARLTAACVVEWGSRESRIYTLVEGVDDQQLLELMLGEAVTKVAIDAPFGWPVEFVEAVAAHHSGEPWPGHPPEALALRETDREVLRVTGRRPLSVSTDRISVASQFRNVF